jgi:1-aminocyclopropane-1-carboxylate deaminase/D-cysteine desulfhydrase-like pyridoxal-dependent ACC family enzyme
LLLTWACLNEDLIVGNGLEKLEKLPRAILAHTPTPIEHLPNMSVKIGGAALYVKRDDCTGLALGGNKARQLEYYVGDALSQDADTILITGAVQSNFVRAAAAATIAIWLKRTTRTRIPVLQCK